VRERERGGERNGERNGERENRVDNAYHLTRFSSQDKYVPPVRTQPELGSANANDVYVFGFASDPINRSLSCSSAPHVYEDSEADRSSDCDVYELRPLRHAPDNERYARVLNGVLEDCHLDEHTA
jgi:hypothetical protein